MISKKLLRQLRDSERSHKSKRNKLESFLLCKGDVVKGEILCQLLTDLKIPAEFRYSIAFDIRSIVSRESVRALREIVHNKKEPHYLRCQALTSLSLLGDYLLHVDLGYILNDPNESTQFRAEAAEKVGGLRITELEPNIISILKENKVDGEILFWCLYACSGFQKSKTLINAIKPYCKDMRKVDTGMKNIAKGPATLASEAQWVTDKLNGINRDPDWMIEN